MRVNSKLDVVYNRHTCILLPQGLNMRRERERERILTRDRIETRKILLQLLALTFLRLFSNLWIKIKILLFLPLKIASLLSEKQINTRVLSSLLLFPTRHLIFRKALSFTFPFISPFRKSNRLSVSRFSSPRKREYLSFQRSIANHRV